MIVVLTLYCERRFVTLVVVWLWLEILQPLGVWGRWVSRAVCSPSFEVLWMLNSRAICSPSFDVILSLSWVGLTLHVVSLDAMILPPPWRLHRRWRGTLSLLPLFVSRMLSSYESCLARTTLGRYVCTGGRWLALWSSLLVRTKVHHFGGGLKTVLHGYWTSVH